MLDELSLGLKALLIAVAKSSGRIVTLLLLGVAVAFDAYLSGDRDTMGRLGGVALLPGVLFDLWEEFSKKHLWPCFGSGVICSLFP